MDSKKLRITQYSLRSLRTAFGYSEQFFTQQCDNPLFNSICIIDNRVAKKLGVQEKTGILEFRLKKSLI